MQNPDNLRTLTGRKSSIKGPRADTRPQKPNPGPNKQNNLPAPNIVNVFPKKKNKKKKKFSQQPSKNMCWMSSLQLQQTQIPNPSPQLQLFESTNIITGPPEPRNTLGQTSGSGPNNPTGQVNTQSQISGSGPNKSPESITTPGQIGAGGPNNKLSVPINTLGQTSASNTPNWSINTPGPISESGPIIPSTPINTPGQTTGSSPNMPSWSTNPLGQISGSGPTNPTGSLNATGHTSSSNKLRWSFNNPGQTGEGGPNMPSWSVNTLEPMSGSTTNNLSRPANPLDQASKTGFNRPPGPNQLGPRFQPPQKEQPVFEPTKPVTPNLTNNANVNLNKVAFEQQQKANRTPHIHGPNFKQNVLIFRPSYPKGIPRSFLTQAVQDNLNAPSNITTSLDMPGWFNASQGNIATNPPTLAPTQNLQSQSMVTNNPVFVQTDTPTDVQQPYSPSDVYDESSFGDDHDGSESSEVGQSAQKRLSAFQRLGPLSQPKKPKLTINLMFNKEQAVREVVDATEEDTEKYTPVHLRPNIIASTDETVVKFLASWPWKKRVPLRRSVTFRNSKSVMILEQEQMEEIYDKDTVFMQVTVRGYPKCWNKEHVLDALLEAVKGKTLIPCFTEFAEDECKFLALRSRWALVMLHKCGFVVRKDNVELSIVISQTDVSLKQIEFMPRLVLRKLLMKRYDGERKLDLKEFTLKEDISHFIYYPLNRLTNQIELIQLQSTVAWDFLTDLDLSFNRITSISGFDLPTITPRLKTLNLSHNHIEKITELLKCRGLSIHCIWLEGNPLCLDYIDPQHYIKVIKMVFTSVKEIDGVPITLSGDLPPIKRNYCPEEATEFVEKFLEVYFPLMDTMPDERSSVQNLYAEDATMTITYRNKLRHSPVYRCFRNLFLRSRALEEGELDSVETSSSIVKLINRWPEFDHDPLTFNVDVLHYDDFTAILRVGGIVKLKAESLAEDEHLLAFTKTFVLRSKDGVEYKIQNELLYWDHPTEEYAATAFKITTVKIKQLSLKLDLTPNEDLKDKLLELFMKLTSLNRKSSERCLEFKSWNFKDALEHFTKLLKLDSLESLTRDDV